VRRCAILQFGVPDYDAQSAVERELVLRLASVLWRLRRATTMDTGPARAASMNPAPHLVFKEMTLDQLLPP
jgi:hypothetical protein